MAFNVPDYTQYVNQSNSTLEDYYRRLLAEEMGDVKRAKRRLLEDYQIGARVINEDYDRNTAFAQESAGAQQQELSLDTAGEQRRLDADLLRRGVEQGGVAQQLQTETTSRKDLRREAIDRALRKNNEDQKYAKERGLEQETIKQRRGTEDVATNFAKFMNEKNQEKQEKAVQLADQAYNRDFAARSTSESFRLQNEGMQLAKDQRG